MESSVDGDCHAKYPMSGCNLKKKVKYNSSNNKFKIKMPKALIKP